MECQFPDKKPKRAYNLGCRCVKCKEGCRQRAKQYRRYHSIDYKGYYQKYIKNYVNKNREKVREYQRKYKRLHPEIARKWHLQKEYGITIDEYNNLCKLQNSCCKICNKQTKLAVDHSHKTGRIRALLCEVCNRGLGTFRDNILILEKAIQYLKKFGE